ncbi:MAG: hypothetical protein M1818_006172 [Claussenomyces sp. TS43310]|nr:MAG: hypothetical protein M1818_006172 [Claussenomyces sp. TS43310]
MCSPDIFLGLIAILFPPLAVWVKTGICSADSLINILLCCLGFLPGLLHAWYIIARYPDPAGYDAVPQDAEGGGRVTYVYVEGPSQQQPQPRQQQQPKNQTRNTMNPGGAPDYGTTAPVAHNLRQGQDGAWNAEGSAAAPPPSYEHAVGDHKVQSK